MLSLDEKIQTLKHLYGQDETDEILTLYLEIAGAKILAKAYPYDATVTEVPERYSLLQCEVALYLLNKRGAEGQTMHAENGVQRLYEAADVPPSMLRGVVAMCGVIK